MAIADTIDVINRLRSEQSAAAPGLPGSSQAWLKSLREHGIEMLADAGLPERKWESWRYTNIGAVQKVLAEMPTAATAATRAVEVPELLEDAYRLVIVDGRCRPELSDLNGLPDGVIFTGLADLLADAPDWLRDALADAAGDRQPMAALNTAFLADGYVLHLEDGTALDRPAEVVFLTGSGLRQPHNVIVAGNNSRATVIERFLGTGEEVYATNSVTQARIGPGANVQRFKIQTEARSAQHHALLHARIERDARLISMELAVGAALARSESRVELTAPGADLRLDGIYLAEGNQENASITEIVHAAGDTTSSEVYKGVLDGRSRGVFQGKIAVRPDAQRINGQQVNKTLLLSDQAEIDTKPELEILADDVKCSHGATAGEIDDNALFYLRSRGIPEDQARGMLIEAFLAEVNDRIEDETIRQAFRRLTAEWLAPRASGSRP